MQREGRHDRWVDTPATQGMEAEWPRPVQGSVHDNPPAGLKPADVSEYFTDEDKLT